MSGVRFKFFWLALVPLLATPHLAAADAGPSFDCAKVKPDSVEETICADDNLSENDSDMAQIYGAILAKTASEKREQLRLEQKAWLMKRNNCAKQAQGNAKTCLRDAYQMRISELETKLRTLLAASAGPPKVYRNEEWGFELEYPDIATQTDTFRSHYAGPAEFPGKSVVGFVYRPNGDSYPDITLRIAVNPGQSKDDACNPLLLSGDEEPNTGQKDAYETINGNRFYVQKRCAGAMSQSACTVNYTTFHNRTCFCLQDYSATTGSLPWMENVLDDAYGQQMSDILKSFRFLDAEPKAAGASSSTTAVPALNRKDPGTNP